MVNSNLWWLVFCLLPEAYRAINQVQTIKGKLDPKWSEYLSRIAGDYKEEPPTETTTPPPYTPRTGWSLARFGESNFVAVIHRKISSSTSKVSLDAGNACGAVLVTKEKLITHCFCLASWYNWVKNGAKGKLTPGNVKSKYDIIAEQIHVTYSELDFDPNFLSKLENKLEGPTSRSCPTNADHREPKMVEVLIVKFAPGIEHPSDGMFMPWPPYPIIVSTGQPVVLTATVMGYGMAARRDKRFWNEFGTEILVNTSTVKFRVENTKYTECAKNPDLWKTLPKELSDKVTCFRATNRNFELCGGLLGSPVLLSGSIHGLVMSTMSCEQFNSDLAVLSFDKTIRDGIESMVGKELHQIKKENWGDDDGNKEVVYLDFLPLKKLQPHSRGTISAPLGLLPVIMLVLLPLSTSVDK